ncbi:oligopeptide transporter, OPT family [bacterium]|nr:oligopeptide transporter, OPT family [bacterium]
MASHPVVQSEGPYVAPETTMAEITIRSIVLGIILSLVLCAANVYVGLYAGMTVSASIPAAVISMAVLRGILRRGTILENNIVQTMASTGESLAAGIIFTVPAIVLLGLWSSFNYFETTMIAVAGGTLGVVMMIPLRRALIVDNTELKYPEGVACTQVLIAGDKGGEDMSGIFKALAIGGGFKVLVNVFGVFKGSVEGALRVGKTAFGFGSDISPMLAAVGFIVGWEISLLVFLGGAIAWLVAIPIVAPMYGLGDGSAIDGVWAIWDSKIRYFGIGAMIVGGVWSIVKVREGILNGVQYALDGLRGKSSGDDDAPRTEQNIRGRDLGVLILVSVALVGAIYLYLTKSVLETGIMTAVMFVLAFFFVAVATYIAGLVGSSNSPVSGMTICTVFVTAGILVVMGYSGAEGMLATLGVAGVVCCAACTSGDIAQDLKTGHMVGATPRRQQWAELVGVVLPALIIAPTMTLLQKAYGIGEPVREGIPALKAPQGMMFKSLVGALFDPAQNLPWGMVMAGALVGFAAVVIDKIWLEKHNHAFRLHVMPLAVGMYLPITVSAPLIVGGLASLALKRKYKNDPDESLRVQHRGTLFASGIVAGEAILGILIAVFVVLQWPLPLDATNLGKKLGGTADIISLVGLVAAVWVLMRYAKAKKVG